MVAVAQIRYFDTGKKDNVDKIKKFIRMAKEANADIVCFPETCIHQTDDLPLNHLLVKEIKKSCKENSIWVIVTDSFIIKGKTYKAALLIDRNGKIRGNYKKINLYDDGTEAGKKIFVYKTDFAKIGIAICWDLAFPELFNRMKRSGAEIVFCPSKWCYEYKAYDKNHSESELSILKSLIKTRAFENLFFIVLASPVMEKQDLVPYSAIVSPHKIIKEIKDEEGMIVSKLNLNEIKKFGKIYPKK